MKQTAVEWLIEKIQSDTFCDHIQGVRCWDKDTLMEFLEKAKQMEKEQTINAHSAGQESAYGFRDKETAEEYYQKTYEK